jgi:hypothetical protein
MSNGEMPEEKKNRESSIRWQGRTIEQFGYAINLILGLAIAAIGFEFSLVLTEKFSGSGWQNCLFGISIVALVLSAGVGLLGVVNRLRDFRATTETARKREDGASDLELQSLRILTNKLGERTWLLFWWQVSAFGVGVLLLVVAVAGSVARALVK